MISATALDMMCSIVKLHDIQVFWFLCMPTKTGFNRYCVKKNYVSINMFDNQSVLLFYLVQTFSLHSPNSQKSFQSGKVGRVSLFWCCLGEHQHMYFSLSGKTMWCYMYFEVLSKENWHIMLSQGFVSLELNMQCYIISGFCLMWCYLRVLSH